MTDRRDCRSCTLPLTADELLRGGGWCGPCGSWEFRHDHDDEPEPDEDDE